MFCSSGRGGPRAEASWATVRSIEFIGTGLRAGLRLEEDVYTMWNQAYVCTDIVLQRGGGGIKYSDEESLLPQSCSLLALCHDSARVGQLQGSRQGLGLPPSAVLQLTGLRAMRRCTFTRERLSCIEPVEAHSTQEQE